MICSSMLYNVPVPWKLGEGFCYDYEMVFKWEGEGGHVGLELAGVR